MPWISFLCGGLAGALFGALHALATVKLNADQTISGTAIKLSGAGRRHPSRQALFNSSDTVPLAPAEKIPLLLNGVSPGGTVWDNFFKNVADELRHDLFGVHRRAGGLVRVLPDQVWPATARLWRTPCRVRHAGHQRARHPLLLRVHVRLPCGTRRRVGDHGDDEPVPPHVRSSVRASSPSPRSSSANSARRARCGRALLFGMCSGLKDRARLEQRDLRAADFDDPVRRDGDRADPVRRSLSRSRRQRQALHQVQVNAKPGEGAFAFTRNRTGGDRCPDWDAQTGCIPIGAIVRLPAPGIRAVRLRAEVAVAIGFRRSAAPILFRARRAIPGNDCQRRGPIHSKR